MNPAFFHEVVDSLLEKTELVNVVPIAGGCINSAAKLITTIGDLFIKWNSDSADKFRKEALGLNELSKANGVFTPKVLNIGHTSMADFLILELIPTSHPSREYWEQLGLGIAKLHKNSNEHFGFGHDNYIGGLPQANNYEVSWHKFFIENRLMPQVKLARQNDYLDKHLCELFEKLYISLDKLLPIEQPSLMHGDLWSGNVLCAQDGTPYLIDPAVYYGHREAEIAFTRLFGGFAESFYESYNGSFPLEHGFQSRIDIYNLYPRLVHLNLFGTAYLTGITDTLTKIIA